MKVERTLSLSDNRKHLPHAFEVPEGTTRIHIEFDYNPPVSQGQPYRNQLSFSLFDPEGPRGVQYCINGKSITVDVNQATPGTRPGIIQSGTWTVLVDAYRLLPPDPITYTLSVSLSSDALTNTPTVWTQSTKPNKGIGWYRGDLHAHSVHSDASWDVPDLVRFARDHQLDFVTLTDHNTITGLAQHDSLSDENLLTMGGMELTTYYGHALTLGTRQWMEWRTDDGDILTMPQAAQRVLDSGALFVIAHPMAPGDPECSGCHWEYTDMRPGNSPAVEVWNGYWTDYNENSLQLYYSWLNEGHRLVATAGSDIHGQPPADEVGRGAANVVYANELTESGIFEAIKQGHSYLSAGPELLVTARSASGIEAMVGDVLPIEDITISVKVNKADAGDVLRLIVDGSVRTIELITESGEFTWDLPTGTGHWFTVELRDAANDMWAVANPIFIGIPEPH